MLANAMMLSKSERSERGRSPPWRQFRQYLKGENDIYWLHCPDKKQFYVIPEDVLILHGFECHCNQ